jgi:hypothetical protein
MFRKMLFLTITASILVETVLFIPGGTGQALAENEISPEDTSCIDCHEDQYYLYDSGKWYCLNETKVRCTECHRGRTDTMIQESAHEGLIANPLINDAVVCQNCHPNDYRAKVQTYSSIAGINPTPRPYATCTPSALISQSGESTGGTRLLRALPPGGWQAVGFIFWGIVFLVLFLYACRCWKTDRWARLMGNPEVESDFYSVS